MDTTDAEDAYAPTVCAAPVYPTEARAWGGGGARSQCRPYHPQDPGRFLVGRWRDQPDRCGLAACWRVRWHGSWRYAAACAGSRGVLAGSRWWGLDRIIRVLQYSRAYVSMRADWVEPSRTASAGMRSKS